MTFRPVVSRAGLLALALLIVAATFSYAGPRAALLMGVGLGLGLTLEGLRFGFAGPWRQLIVDRDSRGMVAQLMAIALTAAVSFPLLSVANDELSAAHAPIGLAMIGGAFVFGAAMQVVMGCGSGTLVNAASGNFSALLALPGFIAGSFLATLHLNWWTDLGTLPVISLQGLFGNSGGLLVTLSGLMILAFIALLRASAGRRLPGSRLWIAAVLLASLAILHLIISGQSWGVVYGLGLWGAKVSQAAGLDLSSNIYWSSGINAQQLQQSVFTDVTSLTNIGIMIGAYTVVQWRRTAVDQQPEPQTRSSAKIAVAMLLAGLVLGYSSRIAFGCNVGAYFSGIATGSLHGWAWLVAAFAGAILGIRLRHRILASTSSQPDPGWLPSRNKSAVYTLVLLSALVIIDFRTARLLNPFAVPPPVALGSGLQPQGAHCTDM